MPKYCNVDNLKHAIHAFVNKYGIIGMSITDFNIMLERNRADVEPVRHGHWIFSQDDAEGTCSCCQYHIYGKPYNGKYLITPYNYCPNCGAKMD